MIKYSLNALQEFFNMPPKTTPVDADVLIMGDSADATNGIIKLTWANLKATILTAVAAVGYAPLASPIFTGTPSLPTGTIAVTQTAGDNSTKAATTAFTKAEITAMVSGANVSLSANGYQKLPNGLIIQWGRSATLTNGVAQTLNFPIYFPNICLQASGTVFSTSLSGTYEVHVSTSNSQISVYPNLSGNVGQTYSYIAIGY